MSLWSRLANVVRGDRLIREIDEELESHLAEAIARGRDPGEARRAFGGLLRQREASRDIRRMVWLGDFLMDLRYGARTLRRQPGFLAAAVLSLGLGIGANAAIFSVIDAALLRSLPVSHPEQLVTVSDSATGGNFSYPDYLALRQGTGTLSDLIAASFTMQVPVGVGGEIDQAFAKAVSGNYFTGLGVGSVLGRVFAPTEEVEPVAVISHDYWRRRFDESATAVGQPVTVDGVLFTVVGVAPAGFSGEAPGESPDMWTSMALRTREMREGRGYSWLYLMGRLKPGESIGQAHADLASLLVQSRPTSPPAETTSRLSVSPGARGLSALRDRFSEPLQVVMALAAIVLLVACTNLAGLLLTRGSARRWEIAMRQAIGASRARVMRQLLTESLLLAAAGGALGIAVAVWGSAALMRLPLGDRPVTLSVGLNLRMLAFTAAISIVAGILFGLAPAWRSARAGAIRGSSRVVGYERVFGLRGALIALQLALSLVLLAGSVMFVRTLRNLQTQDVGFRADHVLLVQIVSERGYRPPLSAFIPRLLERVSGVPGVASASVAVGGTLATIGGVRVQVEGSASRDRLSADWVGPDYFRTAGMTIIAGRDFALADNLRGQKVVIVNQTMARRYFGDGEALGRRVLFNKDQYLIVGIARDAKYADLRETTPPFVYFPTLQTQSGVGHLEIRTSDAAPLALAATIRPLIHDLDPHLSAGTAMTLSDRIDRRLGREHLVADLAGFFGAVTLALLSIGVYGTVAYAVGQRTHEIGVRLALGARRSSIVWMVLRRIVGMVAVGVVVGAAGVLVVGRLVKPLLFGLAPTDPWTIGSASVLLVGVAVLAGGLPARAAAQLDPASVLRE
jgi:predicted permease